MRRKTRRQFPIRGILFIILLIGIILVVSALTEMSEARHRESVNQSVLKAMLISEFTGATIPINVTEIADTRCLELINREYAIGSEPETDLLISAWPSVPVRTTEITLRQTALDAVGKMFAAASEVEDGTFFVSSGYRDYARQEQIYNNESDKSYVQPPGHSEHQAGLAADILVLDIPQSKLGESQEGRWLAENAWKYGLILRYPQDKQNVTGISYEPWHFRYIGQPHSWYCSQNNLCFEEYIQFLKDNGGYQVEYDGKTYYVLYQIPSNGIIYVPESQDYNISNDNTGGYIVTAWE